MLFESIPYLARDTIGIFFAFYDQPTLFSVEANDGGIDSTAPSEVQVGSPIIASTIGGDNFSIENLSEPVIVTLKIVRVSECVVLFALVHVENDLCLEMVNTNDPSIASFSIFSRFF